MNEFLRFLDNLEKFDVISLTDFLKFEKKPLKVFAIAKLFCF